MEEHGSRFNENFEDNKKMLEQVSVIRYKCLKNEVAGYITKSIKKEARKEKIKQEQIASLQSEQAKQKKKLEDSITDASNKADMKDNVFATRSDQNTNLSSLQSATPSSKIAESDKNNNTNLSSLQSATPSSKIAESDKDTTDQDELKTIDSRTLELEKSSSDYPKKQATQTSNEQKNE